MKKKQRMSVEDVGLWIRTRIRIEYRNELRLLEKQGNGTPAEILDQALTDYFAKPSNRAIPVARRRYPDEGVR